MAKLTLQEGQGAEQVAACVVKKLSEQKKTDLGDPMQLQQLKGGKAEFCQKIAEMRNIAQEDVMFRVCQDGEGGSFKSVVSVMDRKVNPET